MQSSHLLDTSLAWRVKVIKYNASIHQCPSYTKDRKIGDTGYREEERKGEQDNWDSWIRMIRRKLCSPCDACFAFKVKYQNRITYTSTSISTLYFIALQCFRKSCDKSGITEQASFFSLNVIERKKERTRRINVKKQVEWNGREKVFYNFWINWH